MPTRSKRAIKKARRLGAVLWWAGAILWAVGILWTERPWLGLSELQSTQWLLGGLCGLLVGTLQRQGKDYWPANTMLGLAYGSDKILYFVLAKLLFAGNTDAFRAWATAVRAGVYAWGASFFLLAWGFYLVLRVNQARNGSSIDIWGRARPPTEQQAREALHVIRRYGNHHTANLLMLPEYGEFVAYMRRQDVGPLVEAELARWRALDKAHDRRGGID